jgi:hypothetical protein
MNKRIIALLAVSLALYSCTANYMMDGVRYQGSDNFQMGVDQQVGQALAQVTPLTKPLTTKKLIVLIPSESAILSENIKRSTALRGIAPSSLALEMIENISKSTYKTMIVLHHGLRKRGVFSEVVINESPSMSNSIEPSKEYDVLYFTEPSQGSGQYFYSSVKHGRQVFPWDRSGSGVGRLNSFIESVQALAIRE